jgi:hypothetical protein
MDNAAKNGHLEMMKYLSRINRTYVFLSEKAAEYGYIQLIEWI